MRPEFHAFGWSSINSGRRSSNTGVSPTGTSETEPLYISLFQRLSTSIHSICDFNIRLLIRDRNRDFFGLVVTKIDSHSQSDYVCDHPRGRRSKNTFPCTLLSRNFMSRMNQLNVLNTEPISVERITFADSIQSCTARFAETACHC
jgi:hypothetical protein